MGGNDPLARPYGYNGKFLFIGKMRDLSALQNLDYVSLLLREKVARFSVTDE